MTVPVSNHRRGRAILEQGTQEDPEQAGPVQRPAITIRRVAGLGPFTVRMPSPVLQGVLALVAYFGIWMLVGWGYPLIVRAHMIQLDQSSQDPNFYVWSLRWWPYAISHGLNPLFSGQVGAPRGFNMAWTTTVPPLALLATPLTALAGPVVAFNLLAAFAPPLSAWAAFVACRRLTKRFWPALFGGAVFGFCAYEVNHTAAGQLNLTWTLLLPLILYLVVLWRDGKLSRAWFISLMALTMLLQFFLFIETFAEMTVVLAVGLLVGYLVAGRSGRPTVARLAGYVSVAYAAVILVASPYLVYALSHYPKGFTRSPAVTGLDLANLVVPRTGHTFGLTGLDHYAKLLPSASQAGYVGIPLLLILLLAAIFSWSNKLSRVLVLVFIAIVALAIGPDLVVGTSHVGSVPWSHLWFRPIARSALPNRFMLLGSLTLGVLVAVWLASPLRNRWLQAGRWLLALVAVAALLSDVPAVNRNTTPVKEQMPAFITTGEYQRYLHPGEIVMVISTRGNAGMLFQADTNFYFRISGGYINMAITPGSDLPRAASRLSKPTQAIQTQFLAYLKRTGVGAILLEVTKEPKWWNILTKMGFEGKAVDGVIFYPVGPCVIACPPASHS